MEVKPVYGIFIKFCLDPMTFIPVFWFALGLPQGKEKQESEQFFRKVLGPSEGSTLSGTVQTSIRPVLEVDNNHGGLPLRNLPGKIQSKTRLPTDS
ncbi:MAG: hypothetical protein ACRC4N_00915 [Gammaproteobacteria bacterium]